MTVTGSVQCNISSVSEKLIDKNRNVLGLTLLQSTSNQVTLYILPLELKIIDNYQLIYELFYELFEIYAY